MTSADLDDPLATWGDKGARVQSGKPVELRFPELVEVIAQVRAALLEVAGDLDRHLATTSTDEDDKRFEVAAIQKLGRAMLRKAKDDKR